jgi:hypothetical protein
VCQLVQALEATKGFQPKDFLKPSNQDSHDILGDTATLDKELLLKRVQDPNIHYKLKQM